MKMKRFKYFIAFTLTFFALFSCNFDESLEENAKDFLTPENSYTDVSGFEAALANVYLTIRTHLYATQDAFQAYDMLGVGADIVTRRINNDSYNNYMHWDTFNADSDFTKRWWTRFYSWIYQTNTIIERADADVVTWESEEQKNAIIGEAKFLRAFAYRFLANMWGGVPIILNETTSAKFDYTRATQEEVYELCKEDLTFALKWMKPINELAGGKASKAAAYHLLAEINICLEEYDEAISAASQVIDDPNFHLMNERFGVYKDFRFNGYDYQGEYEDWGDVYWDLFRENNTNWIDGNHEAIWNVQFDFDILGGGNDNAAGGYFGLERHLGGAGWAIWDKEGGSNWLKDTLMGRPAATTVSTAYVDSLIWKYKGDWDKDIRNSKYNIQRDWYFLNPKSKQYGEKITYDNTARYIYFYRHCSPSFKKTVSALHHGLFVDSDSGEKHDNGKIYKDWYIMRLPETYLLRAEAYLKKGDSESAANDINVVRNRAKATPVTSADVDMELILDERARELLFEEFRYNTLMRMGKLAEHLRNYNSSVIFNGLTVGDHVNKFPIPNSEIEANTEAELLQNPGYN